MKFARDCYFHDHSDWFSPHTDTDSDPDSDPERLCPAHWAKYSLQALWGLAICFTQRGGGNWTWAFIIFGRSDAHVIATVDMVAYLAWREGTEILRNVRACQGSLGA